MTGLRKSVDFLLENAGPVIQYRLRKEILNDLPKTEEENLLERIYETPLFRLLKTYVKPSGYIGTGMHSWDNWRGAVLHETPLQDGETAARLLSYYAVPREHPLMAGFAAVLRDENVLREEFSYIPPEAERFKNRYIGINSGSSLMSLVYTARAALGFGDEDERIKEFQQTALKGFRRVLEISSLDEITDLRDRPATKYNYPFISAVEYFPCVYTLAALAYSQSWRSEENIKTLSCAIDHINAVMKPDSNMHVKISGKYYAPWGALNRPIRAFRADLIDSINYRRLLTEIAMLGVGERAGVIRESAENVKEALDADGILRMRFDLPHNKRYSPKSITYPTPYVDTRLEPDYKKKYALECDLTFWAVQFLTLAGEGAEKLI